MKQTTCPTPTDEELTAIERRFAGTDANLAQWLQDTEERLRRKLLGHRGLPS